MNSTQPEPVVFSSPHSAAQNTPPATVFVVDDDPAVRESLAVMLRAVPLPVRTYASAQDFLEQYDGIRPGCMILDYRMPGMNGLELLDSLEKRRISMPVLMITGHGDVPLAVRAMKSGVVDFLEKPYTPRYLLDLIQTAILQDQEKWGDESHRLDAIERMSTLTPEERSVLELLLAGLAMKKIASELDVSLRTVHSRRAEIMDKLGVRSRAQLVQKAILAEPELLTNPSADPDDN